MTNEELNTALYEKMFAEQQRYREWLLSQPPDEILNHCYEFTVREDIVLALEYHDLSDKQCKALLQSRSPLADVFKDFEKRETDHMYLPSFPPIFLVDNMVSASSVHAHGTFDNAVGIEILFFKFSVEAAFTHNDDPVAHTDDLRHF